MFKKDLRKKYRNLRNSLSLESQTTLSLAIANKLLELPIWSFNYYHIFLPIVDKVEIDTSNILSILQGKDKNVAVPKIIGEHKMISYLVTDNMRFVENKWGVPEPMDGLEVPPLKIDVVFLPLLAYDTKGNRVGYGKGYYDTFLRQCKPTTLKIGLSFFPPEPVITDAWENDVPMDYCITPEKNYRF